jgi:hypothetical protein
MDYILKPMGKSLVKNPEVMDLIKNQMSSSENSPILARAPILLSESLVFPYREGLSFEQDLWMDKGQTAAFAGALDRPPTSTWEIINPLEYEKKHLPSVPLMPDIHPLVDKLYKPYDIGQVGQLDLHILAEIFGGDQAARDLTPAWDGGIYWAGQRLDATQAEQGTTKSLAMFYLSAWKNAASAQAFAKLYADDLGRKYSGLKPGVPGDGSLSLGSKPDLAAQKLRSRSSPPTKAPSSSPPAANSSSSRRASTLTSPASSPSCSSIPKAPAPSAWPAPNQAKKWVPHPWASFRAQRWEWNNLSLGPWILSPPASLVSSPTPA